VAALLPFRLHPWVIVAIVAIGLAHHVVVSTPRQRATGRYALLALLLVTVWPVGDLAAKVSLSVATAQRLVIMLLVAPLLLMSLPTAALARLTRPSPVDYVVRKLAHPGVAIVVVTLVGTTTLIAPVVDWGARSELARDLILVVVLGVGLLLWIPALAVVPGTRHLSPVARAGYVFGSALVVTSLSFVWIFARHPLYSGLHGQYALLHMTPLFDQQLAGFVAKFGSYVPMGWVAFVIFARAEERGIAVEETPLHWADVERDLLRLDRKRARATGHERPGP
jgi:cytochrome c oxidase assembly factor CtaG